MNQTRFESLKEQLLSTFPVIGVWLQRRAMDLLWESLAGGDRHAVSLIAQAVASSAHGPLRATGLQMLGTIGSDHLADEVVDVWSRTRSPDLEGLILERCWTGSGGGEMLLALVCGRREILEVMTSDGLSVLVEAWHDPDPKIRGRAREWLTNLENEEYVCLLCEWWVQSRNAMLAEILSAAGYLPGHPWSLRVLVALKVDRTEIAMGVPAEVVDYLVEAACDADTDIAERAIKALENLEQEASREVLCQRLIDGADGLVREVVLRAAYEPRNPGQRAVFLLLTGQLERYHEVDFDRGLLRNEYTRAGEAERKRILQAIRESGRADILAAVVGKGGQVAIEGEEARLAIDLLARNGEWSHLWRLAQDLPPAFALEAVRRLVSRGWSPELKSDRWTFQRLQRISESFGDLNFSVLGSQLPLIVLNASVRVPGRINAVAFSPEEPVLAVGTGRRKVVLWDFQHGSRVRTFGALGRSVGRVAFLTDGSLVVGERCRGMDEDCRLFLARRGEQSLRPFGSHTGSVTALLPVAGGRLVSTGREGHIKLWNPPEETAILSARLTRGWPRSAVGSADGDRIALLFQGAAVARLPDLVGEGVAWPTVSRSASFAPDGKGLIVGRFNGRVVYCSPNSGQAWPRPEVLWQHEGRVEGVVSLADRALVITAGSEGALQIREWPSGVLRGAVVVPGGSLTSMRVSPDGSCLAVGHSQCRMSLWDLRALDLPEIMTQPMAYANPGRLSAVRALLGCIELPGSVRSALRFVRVMLEHRMQYEIELDEAPVIKVGEFDIELEEDGG